MKKLFFLLTLSAAFYSRANMTEMGIGFVSLLCGMGYHVISDATYIYTHGVAPQWQPTHSVRLAENDKDYVKIIEKLTQERDQLQTIASGEHTARKRKLGADVAMVLGTIIFIDGARR